MRPFCWTHPPAARLCVPKHCPFSVIYCSLWIISFGEFPIYFQFVHRLGSTTSAQGPLRVVARSPPFRLPELLLLSRLQAGARAVLGGRKHGACPAGLRQHPQNTAWAEVMALQAAARSGTGSGPSAANAVTLCIKHFTSQAGHFWWGLGGPAENAQGMQGMVRQKSRSHSRWVKSSLTLSEILRLYMGHLMESPQQQPRFLVRAGVS